MDINDYRAELLNTVCERLSKEHISDEMMQFGLFCEYADRLTQAEEFSDVIPSLYTGTGSRSRKLRVDGYQLDEADSSLRLIVCDFSGAMTAESMTRTKAEGLFRQVLAFVEDSISNRIWSESNVGAADGLELAGMIANEHEGIARYRIYLFTDSILSGRIRELQEVEINGTPAELHVWDVSRLAAVSTSTLGLEELEIDLTEYIPGGLPCLPASSTDEYSGYLAVIPGDVLAKLYDRYGSKLLEGNVRSYLTARGKINKGIQGTVRAEPEKFFIYNNGITCTATDAKLDSKSDECRLMSVTYLQIVNGGQTTASLHTAMKLDRADLSKIAIQMKLSVVRADEVEKLEELIERIARYSNSQNKVSEADFFSNHPYHQALERLSRRLAAPAAPGAQFNTYWFYERARGQYQNAQLHLTPAKRKEFQRLNPSHQLIVKTDVAKFENSWMRKPYLVSRGAQKNFSDFASYISARWGKDGSSFNNDSYYRNVIARAILFRSAERLVSSAEWYQTGLPRAQIVTYTVAKLSQLIEDHAAGSCLDFKSIWNAQALKNDLEGFMQKLAKGVCEIITNPPVHGMHIGEWSKKDKCWETVKGLDVSLPRSIVDTLVSAEEAHAAQKGAKIQGREDSKINALTTVVELGAGYWRELGIWASQYSPIYGKEADLVRNASKLPAWIPTDRQATVLLSVREKVEHEGFRGTSSSQV